MTDYTGIPAIDAALEAGDVSTNRLGNTVCSTFLFLTERYLFDFNLDRDRWLQVDTEGDAWYLGFWVCLTGRCTLSYIEGDLYFVQCDDDESYDREVAQLCADNKPAPAFAVIDPEAGTRTDVYEDRRVLFIDPDRGEVLIAELGQTED